MHFTTKDARELASMLRNKADGLHEIARDLENRARDTVLMGSGGAWRCSCGTHEVCAVCLSGCKV